MRYGGRVLTIGLVLALVVAEPAPAAPADAPPPLPWRALGPGETIRVDLAQVPLVDVARLVSCALERNVLFDPPSLGGAPVTVLGPRPIGRRDLERLWHAILLEHGLVSERHGAFDRIRRARP